MDKSTMRTVFDLYASGPNSSDANAPIHHTSDPTLVHQLLTSLFNTYITSGPMDVSKIQKCQVIIDVIILTHC